MTILEDFHSYFQAKGLLEGWTAYGDGFQDFPDKAVSINEYGSSLPHVAITGVTIQIQIVTRAPTVSEAKAKAWELFHAVRVPEIRLDLTPERWVHLSVHSNPFKMKVDEHKRVYYVFNMTCTTST